MSEGGTKETRETMYTCMGVMEGMRAEEEKEVCPMATMCKGMMAKRGFGILLLIPGTVLILGGVLILLNPNILFWLLAGTSIFLGVAMSGLAVFLYKMGGRFRHMHP